ncbi:hypothetical protein NP493_1167g00022 [Ridgeia piscesae]|uniref:Zinc transporter ZIP14 n=1 Tax=Ridgeia piscesae TaxID=27915 RepID=A0AAD9NHA6_RIDPI|nr:hypothetical protein NP493_1167g00022 [Ridgeia piscesae]
MTRVVTFVVFLSLLALTTAASELFFAEQLIEHYGQNDGLQVTGLKNLIAAAGARGNASDGDHHGMACAGKSWISNTTCLKNMCMSAKDMFEFHSFKPDSSLNATDVKDISATVLYRTSSKNCAGEVEKKSSVKTKPTRLQSWGIGLLAVTAINLTSVLGFFFKPIMGTPIYKRVMMYMVSLAVGTLSGNSLMILIPEGFQFAESEYANIYAWRLCTVCGGIYLFFVTERCLTLLLEYLEKRNAEKEDTADAAMPPPSITIHTDTRQDRLNLPFEDIHKTTNRSESTTELKNDFKEGHGHSHGTTIRTVGWMIIFGDGIHNLMDGLSLGAAFSQNLLGALSISLGVLSEELPHELGDFAVLLNSGMTMKQAVGFNFLSACTCYIGFVAGEIIGETTSGTSWVLLLTAGMFLYIALVDMLPEVNAAAEEASKESGQAFSVFLTQNLGLLSGWIIILMLALYAGKISLG